MLFLFLLVGFGVGYLGARRNGTQTASDGPLPQAEQRRRFLVSYGPLLVALFGAGLGVSLLIELA